MTKKTNHDHYKAQRDKQDALKTKAMKSLTVDQLNAIKAALDMIILAVAHLPDLAFTSPNQELLETETIDTLALLLCQGITNNK